MSYDLLAFDPTAVADEDFPAWWEEQAGWSEDHSYDDPSVTTPALRAFYGELTQTFPPLDGHTMEEFDADPDLLARPSSYSIGTSLVYGCFSWSRAGQAQEVFVDLALRHGVAVALVSEDGSILRP